MKNTGGLQSPPDDRDLKLEIVAGAVGALPASSFIDVDALPVWMQNKIGACVGHAWGKSQQYCEFKETGQIINLSARFLYAMSKCLDGIPGEGTFPRITGKILKNYGCATESTIPNDTTLDHEVYVYQRNFDNIPKAALNEAPKYKIDGYAFSDSTEFGIKQAISYAKEKSQGVVMLMRVGDTMWTDVNGNVTWDKNKILPLRPPKQVTSGHEVYPYGYDYKNGRLAIYFLNSWSKDWADNGKGWFYFDEWHDFIVEIMTSVDKSDLPNNVFQKDLTLGATDPDVKKLQKLLNDFGYTVANTGPGSAGQETTFFGNLTKLAVIKLQRVYGLPQTGFFGPLTRQVANKLS